ncbi:MAG: UV DNA damage repair endonuclease UvsE [Candidatus Eisenbacteria bacterium]|nr:UV DNA damage repair endonuclease UvsE [Candidatus Eisenbacteria bacterium]
MRIGYPCINWSVGCKGDRTFRLKSYSEERLIDTVRSNLACLCSMLRYNAAHDMLFFRITSDLVPFASHSVCRFDWVARFASSFSDAGAYTRDHGIRISMHPDQFVLLNSPSEEVTARSIAELAYHVDVLDAMGLGADAKIQIHVGGAYGDRARSVKRFIDRFQRLDDRIRRRLVVENDDRLFGLTDCLAISADTGVPVVFDWFHHQILSSGQPLPEALGLAASTWAPEDGAPIVDYSSQLPHSRPGSHAESIDMADFDEFLAKSHPHDFDLMLEIKDKEVSALKAVAKARSDARFIPGESG